MLIWLVMIMMVDVIKCSSSLGESFNIQKIDIEGVVKGGRKVFTTLAPSCFIREDLKETTKFNKVYNNHENFVHEIATSVGLTAKELGSKASINAKYLKKSSSETSGFIVEVIYLRETQIISDECLEESEIDPELLKELATLPYPILKPHRRANWRVYDAFIHKWGSHILKSTQLGAKATYHMSKTKTSVTDNKELMFKMCAKLPELNLDGCVDGGPKSSSTKNNEDETNEVFVLGGTSKTQAQLREGKFTAELLNTLSEEAAANAVPTKHTWFSLPELLYSRISIMAMLGKVNVALEQRAMALLSYYKGYHVFGCDHQEVAGYNVTVFVNVGGDDFPEYQCHQIKAGCQRDSDCRNWPIKYMGPCYCAGETCFSLKKAGIRKEQSNEYKLRLYIEGNYTDTTNKRCYFSKKGCSCDLRGQTLEEVWPLGSVLLQSKAPTSYLPIWIWKIVLFITVLLTVFTCLILVILKKGKSKSE